MTLSSPITDLRGVGPEIAGKYRLLGIETIGQLIDYFPRKYDDYSDVQTIARIRPGTVTLKARIKQVKGRYVRRGMHVTEAVASDETGSVRLVWFNQPYRAGAIKADAEYFISGEFGLNRQRLSITNPAMELASDFPINTARIVPVYRETAGLKSAQLRRSLKQTLPLIRRLPETLPAWLLKDRRLISRAEAVQAVHFPDSSADLKAARRRLGFEEVFELTLSSLLTRQNLLKETGVPVEFDLKLARRFVGNLPFKLTDAQRKVIWRIYQDMARPQPMNRLVEGDVGSGKTVVAAMAAVMVMQQGYQVALLAPTEVLARQHAETIHRLLTPLGLCGQVSLLVGSLSAAQKRQAHDRIKSGEIKFMIGTHALLQEKVDLQQLGLVIIDEQHRFGVEQRKMLQKKSGHTPHLLSMTATPIPRSLALTLYGELDVSVLDELPGGRQPIKTRLCSPNSRDELYQKIDAELAAGRQMFAVCPLISETDFLPAISAEKLYEQFSRRTFKHRRVGLLHGKMKPAEKEAVMRQFVEGSLDILVATTVIEVGVDVPNASVMLIEGADRFGLAQIHQLRGRVGRGEHQGYCYLVTSDSSPPSRRLRALESLTDGFKLAELDMELRGPGAIYGTLQHGQLDLRIARLADTKLIAEARQAAEAFISRGEDLLQYRHLSDRVSKLRQVTNLN